MNRMTVTLGLVALLVLAGGCTRGVKEVFGVVGGGKGLCAPIQAPACPLGMYKNIEVGKITDDFGGTMPPQLLAMLPGQIVQQLKARGLPAGGSGKTLIIQGKIIYYEEAQVVEQIFGPLEEAIGRFQLVDGASNEVIAIACIVGRSNSTTSQGVATKSEGLAEGIADWIAGHCPQPARTVKK